MSTIFSDEEKRIANSIKNNRELVETTILSTDERVLARVTDGIYRQPGSALRELISNAYDADATQVVVRTDEPRFNTITIEDNGNGMSPEVLSYLIHHIGGSAKRNEIGTTSGVTDTNDYNLSPKGRKLIGKIGIGLFSVAQLTQSFQIITKKKGDKYRSVATVSLTQFAENINLTDDKKEYKSGMVKLWTEKASDTETHGTTIILNKIRPQTRETLQSKRIWNSVVSSRQEFEENGAIPIEPPKYHIGIIDDNDIILDVGKKNRSLPWLQNDSPDEAFSKLVRTVWNISGINNIRASQLFDYYLKMIWDLALSIPGEYVEKSIFDLPFDDQFYAYKISNSPKGQAIPIELSIGETLSNYINTSEKKESFEVIIDNVKLSRPIAFDNLPITSHAVKRPMVFIGDFEENFEGKPVNFTAGPLKFHAYLFWNSKISPVEHQGVMIRINGASGTIFDETFMHYQVQENTRKRQVTCEIFVEKGLDSALNIDRESYNFSHPHVVILTRWLHNAFRQLTNSNKALAKKVRIVNHDEKEIHVKSQLEKIVSKAWTNAGNDEFQSPPTVFILEDDVAKDSKVLSSDFVVNLQTSDLIEKIDSTSGKVPNNRKIITPLNSEKIRAITSILASYGVLENMPKNKIDNMILAIYQVIVAEDDK